jgi:hypothetical protein
MCFNEKAANFAESAPSLISGRAGEGKKAN